VTRSYVREEQPLTREQANLLWVLNRDVQMHGAPRVKAVSEKATRLNDRRRELRALRAAEVSA